MVISLIPLIIIIVILIILEVFWYKQRQQLKAKIGQELSKYSKDELIKLNEEYIRYSYDIKGFHKIIYIPFEEESLRIQKEIEMRNDLWVNLI